MSGYFVSEVDQPRARRASDAVTIVTGLLLVLWTGTNADRVLAVEEALVGLVGAAPSWFDQVYRIIYFVGFVLVVGLAIAVIAQGRRHLDLLRDIAIAFLATLGLGMLLADRRLCIEGEGPHRV